MLVFLPGRQGVEFPDEGVVLVEGLQQVEVELVGLLHQAYSKLVDGNGGHDGLEECVDEIICANAQLVEVPSVHQVQPVGLGGPFMRAHFHRQVRSCAVAVC